MKYTCKTGIFLACVGLLSSGPGFTENLAAESSPESSSTAPVAYVYVQTHQGVDVFDASSEGKLTVVKGSPFATTGQMAGVTASHLLSVGTNELHSYAIDGGGVVGKQLSEINTQDYAGADCGNTTNNGAVLDHSGKYLYVQLWAYQSPGNCAAWQSYKIASDGDLTFLGNAEYSGYVDGYATSDSVPTVSGNDKYAYGVATSYEEGEGYNFSQFAPFSQGSNGALALDENFTETDPKPDPNAEGGWNQVLVAADPSGHLAALMFEGYPSYDTGNYTKPGPMLLGSYSIGSNGSVKSTNTYKDMPSPEISGSLLQMSPSGKLLALAGLGIQIFHFNGASPITKFSSLILPGVSIDQLSWDSNNHLYALSYGSDKLYVFTVTSTSVDEAAGSPFTVGNAYGTSGLIVVPK
ncbi:MAG: hypothetical protein ABSF53_17305 [Terracidiphilus sp.]